MTGLAYLALLGAHSRTRGDTPGHPQVVPDGKGETHWCPACDSHRTRTADEECPVCRVKEKP